MSIRKLVLIRPKGQAVLECLGLGYLASYSYRFGFAPHQYQYFDAEYETDETIVSGASDADVVGISVTSFQIRHAVELTASIREVNPEVRVVWGGYGVSGLTPDQLIEEYGHVVDHFVQGPGEEAWVEVLRDPQAKRVIRKRLIEHLDDVPFPDRELIRVNRHIAQLTRRGEGRRATMEIQRGGCPFDCVFCAARSFTQQHGSTRSAENIVAEMAMLQECYKMDARSTVLACDAEVMLTPEMRRVGELKLERGIEFQLAMSVLAFDVANPNRQDTLEVLVRAGLAEVWMGVESGPSLMPLTGKPITPEQVREAFRVTRALGLRRKAFFVLGFTPEETEETLQERVQFIEEIDPDLVSFSLYVPLPGSRGYDHDRHRHIDYPSLYRDGNKYTSTASLTNEMLNEWVERLEERFGDHIRLTASALPAREVRRLTEAEQELEVTTHPLLPGKRDEEP